MADADSVPAAPRRGFSLAAILFLLVIGAVGGGYLVLSWPQLFARVTDSLPFRVEPKTEPPRNLTTLEARLVVLEKQIARQTEAAERFNAARYTVQDLDARVSKLEAQNAALVMRNAAATMTLADLIRLSDSGRPFDSQLTLLKNLLPDAPEIKQLERYAAAGVPSESRLTESFGPAADAALAADRQAAARDWLSRLWQKITSLVSVRRVGNASGNDAESRLARAGQLLLSHDLAGAMREMRALPPEARAAAKDWMGDADARLAVSGTCSAIAARLARQLGASASEGSPP